MRSMLAQPIPVRALALSAVAALIVTLVALVGPVSADRPGNNGTVKIDGIPFDDHPNNEPHPGCVFQVDFYGYDAGALFASVTFEHWNPTGDGHGDVLLHEEGIWIGEDDNGGGGSEAGLDASRTYNLSAQLAGMEPHPQQGYHIKLTVHADGSQGADVKHKVFWVECAPNGGGGGGEQGQVLLQKVDQTGAGKAGAVFTLTGVTDASFSATATTSATGSAGFTALIAGTYSLAETTPPSGCTGFAGSIAITVEADGDVTVGSLPAGVTFTAGTIRVVNTCGGGSLGELPLNLVKRNQSGAALNGVSFTLAGQGTGLTVLTNAQGMAAFTNLQAGVYTLSEVAPAGCTGIGTISVTIAANGSVTVANQPASVTISGNTLTIVNNCGSGFAGGGGGAGGGAGGSGTLGSSAGTGARSLPNTAIAPAAGTALGAVVSLLTILTLGVGSWAAAVEVRRRR